MLSFITKKKISEEQMASHVVNNTIQLVDESFQDVAFLINNDSDLIKSPEIQAVDFDEFMIIVISGNLELVPKYFHDFQDVRLLKHLHKKFAECFEMDLDEFKKLVADYQSYFARINSPSKNILYGMSRAVFYKYNLNQYQAEYFRKMNAPNPIFLKKLCDILQNFIWEWENYQKKYKIAE